MKLIPFLLAACVIMAFFLGVGGGWLMPTLGVEGPLAQAIPAAIGGALIAVLYVRMVKKPGDAR